MLQELHLLLLPLVGWLTLPRGTLLCTPSWPVARACNRCKLQHLEQDAANLSNPGAGVWQSRSDGRVYGADSGEGRSLPPQKTCCHPSTLLGPHGCPSDNAHGQQDTGLATPYFSHDIFIIVDCCCSLYQSTIFYSVCVPILNAWVI